ncbi:hypothetical protein ACHAXR_011805 [Thalassiosira sp. AJA248-18]
MQRRRVLVTLPPPFSKINFPLGIMMKQSDTTFAAAAAALSDNKKHATASCCKKSVFPSPDEISQLDSDEEEELGAFIYKSSLAARKRQGEVISQQENVAVLDQSADSISTNNDENDLECENELSNRDFAEVNQLYMAKQDIDDTVGGTYLPPDEVNNRTNRTQATRKRNQTELLNEKAGKVTNDRVKRLDSIGFAVDVQDHMSQWDERFLALQRYKKEHGNCLVPRRYSDDPQLARWVKNQRYRCNDAKAGKVTDDRVKRLNSIGFEFDVFMNKWDEQFAALQRYKKEHGNCLVPKRYIDDPQLGSWVVKQRRDAKEGKVSDDQKKRLDSIGFAFDFQDLTSQWDEQFAALQRYKKEHGNCSVPRRYSDDPQLARWVANQRYRRHAKVGKVTDDRVKRLNSIGFEFDVFMNKWDEQFAALQRYKKEHGNCLVPAKYSDDPQLGSWVKNQRSNAKAGKVSDDRLKRLESIGFAYKA